MKYSEARRFMHDMLRERSLESSDLPLKKRLDLSVLAWKFARKPESEKDYVAEKVGKIADDFYVRNKDRTREDLGILSTETENSIDRLNDFREVLGRAREEFAEQVYGSEKAIYDKLMRYSLDKNKEKFRKQRDTRRESLEKMLEKNHMSVDRKLDSTKGKIATRYDRERKSLMKSFYKGVKETLEEQSFL